MIRSCVCTSAAPGPCPGCCSAPCIWCSRCPPPGSCSECGTSPPSQGSRTDNIFPCTCKYFLHSAHLAVPVHATVRDLPEDVPGAAGAALPRPGATCTHCTVLCPAIVLLYYCTVLGTYGAHVLAGDGGDRPPRWWGGPPSLRGPLPGRGGPRLVSVPPVAGHQGRHRGCGGQGRLGPRVDLFLW